MDSNISIYIAKLYSLSSIIMQFQVYTCIFLSGFSDCDVPDLILLVLLYYIKDVATHISSSYKVP